jgi:hypothetical protein
MRRSNTKRGTPMWAFAAARASSFIRLLPRGGDGASGFSPQVRTHQPSGWASVHWNRKVSPPLWRSSTITPAFVGVRQGVAERVHRRSQHPGLVVAILHERLAVEIHPFDTRPRGALRPAHVELAVRGVANCAQQAGLVAKQNDILRGVSHRDEGEAFVLRVLADALVAAALSVPGAQLVAAAGCARANSGPLRPSPRRPARGAGAPWGARRRGGAGDPRRTPPRSRPGGESSPAPRLPTWVWRLR